HRPGKELLNLTPATLEELLFDDIPFLRVAQQEHDFFAQTLRDHGVEVVYLEGLMADVLDQSPVLRETFLKQFIFEAGIRTDRYQRIIFDYLNEGFPNNKDLIVKAMEGLSLHELDTAQHKHKSLIDLVSDSSKLVIDPMPNLYFTRDPFATIGNGVSINRMTYETRNRETIFGEYIFKYHPDLKDAVNYYNRYSAFHIEGGDILNISDKVLAVGISQRTEPDAIDALATSIFASEESSIEAILAFHIPDTRAFMHLDTVFTMIDTDKFTVHPGILGPLAIFEITPGASAEDLKVKEIHATLEEVLSEYLGHPVELINCGGVDRIAAEREQWNDGSNTLAIAPGTIVVYERNEVTNEILKERGLNVIEIPSAELSRGRGGPRCMSMPLWRED
ncbi:MAG: arginine deiminase, partial [Eggerthellaceae bacterium]|nr:arginine deiminase [Eggerthellaceae bacterium]